MSDQPNGNQNHKNGLGPVTREKYEKIIHERISGRIKALDKQIEAHRSDALAEYLKKEGLAEKLARCRSLFEELRAVFDSDHYVHPQWLESNHELFGTKKVRDGVESILRGKPQLKPAFAEVDRLRELEARVAEKVWLAGAPDEIAKLLKEIGDSAASKVAA